MLSSVWLYRSVGRRGGRFRGEVYGFYARNENRLTRHSSPSDGGQYGMAYRHDKANDRLRASLAVIPNEHRVLVSLPRKKWLIEVIGVIISLSREVKAIIMRLSQCWHVISRLLAICLDEIRNDNSIPLRCGQKWSAVDSAMAWRLRYAFTSHAAL